MNDILDVYSFIAKYDSVEAALNLLDKLETQCNKLSNMPERGHIPIELAEE